MSDTICAIATAAGGALGIIRISGDEAIAAAAKIFIPKNKKLSFIDAPANYAVFGVIKDGENTLDEVLATPYKVPHSYTGEDSVEFSCHGSTYILNRVIQLLIANGCRLANPGEFTERAFLNGKMDLSQAEAVADLIASRSEVSHKVAMNQLRGGFKDRIGALRERLVNIQSLLELELDFSDHEELDFADHTRLVTLAEGIRDEMQSLTRSFTTLNAVKSGIPVAIVGNTNVGKSTLMNALLSDSRAIVSNIPGTTRDTIEERIIIGGAEFRLIDTAGIRETNDVVESLGIDKTFQVIDNAQIILWVTSAPELIAAGASAIDAEETRFLGDKNKKIIAVINKTDAITDEASLTAAQALIRKHLHRITETNATTAAHTDAQTCGPASNGRDTDSIANDSATIARNSATIARGFNYNVFDSASITDSSDSIACCSASVVCSSVSIVCTSAKNNVGIDTLEHELINAANLGKTNASDSIVINERHYQALSQAINNINCIISGLYDNLPADLISQDLREALVHLSSISGEITSQEILNNIFSAFCVGK